MQRTDKSAAFSFPDTFTPGEQTLQDHVTVVASDGVHLAVRIYEPKEEQTDSHSHSNDKTVLVFYHGGGAHSGAGYQYLAKGLAENFGLTVYLPDLRGHGKSDGPKGDALSKEQVWRDVDTVLEFVAKPDAKIFLGGHSSGGGLVVNYATAWKERTTSVDIKGYVLVSPELGYKSETARPGRIDFAKVNICAFIANGIFGILGHSRAVKFNYPPEILEDDGMVGFNTVNMANAITPETPREQMQGMCANVGRRPTGLWIGSEDELFIPEKVADFVPNEDGNVGQVLPGKTHLDILVGVHEHIGRWIT